MNFKRLQLGRKTFLPRTRYTGGSRAAKFCYFDFPLQHNRDLSRTMKELARVSKHGTVIVIDELYTHSALQCARESHLGRWVYPKLAPHIYKHREPYITEDERKLNEKDIAAICETLTDPTCTYFNAAVNRFTPDWDMAEIADRALLTVLWPIRELVAGRVIVKGLIS